MENSFTIEISAYGYYKKRTLNEEINHVLLSKQHTDRPIEIYKIHDYLEIGAKIAQSLFHYSSFQKALEKVEKLSSGHLKIEKQIELANIVAKGNTVQFLEKTKGTQAGVSGLVEKIKERIVGGRSVSPGNADYKRRQTVLINTRNNEELNRTMSGNFTGSFESCTNQGFQTKILEKSKEIAENLENQNLLGVFFCHFGYKI